MFTTDSRTEKFLDWAGVKWRYSNDTTFADLIPTWDIENLGRPTVRVDAAVAEYGALMEQGSPAPAPILWRVPAHIKDGAFYGKKDVIDGRQRLLAEELQKPATFSSYDVETDSADMITKLKVLANKHLQGGHQESSEWTLAQVVVLLINTGIMTISEAVKWGWTASQIRDKKQILDYGDKIRCAGGPQKLADSLIRVIAKQADVTDFKSASVPVSGFLTDIRNMQLTTTEAEPYIEEFFMVSRSKGKVYTQFDRKLKDFREQEDVVARLADPNRSRYQKVTPELRILKSLKGALTASKGALKKQEPIRDMDEFFQLVNQIRSTLKKIEQYSKKR